MDAKEHYFMLLMLARIHECFHVITDTLTSRGLWNDGDQKAFAEVVHFDTEKVRVCMRVAMEDYFRLSQAVGLVTGLEDGLPPQ